MIMRWNKGNALHNQGGYILLELLTAIFIVLIILGGIMLQIGAYEKAYYKKQVYMAANQVANELRNLQQDSMYSNLYTSIDINNREGYFLNRSAKVIKLCWFKDYGCDGVYFNHFIATTHFSKDGAPYKSGRYILSHKKLPEYQYVVEVQPITGRVLVSEKK